MNEALGGSGLFNIVIVIVSALVLLLVGFLAFSKAFKVKNHIVNFINEDKGYVDDSKIESDLYSVGYSSVNTIKCENSNAYLKLQSKATEANKEKGECATLSSSNKCNTVEIVMPSYEKNTSFDLCIFKYTSSDGSYYYTVLTYVHMNIPLIDDFIHIPITGETRIFERQYE